MAPRDFLSTFASRALWSCCVAGLWLNGCSDASEPADSGTDGGTNTGTPSTTTASMAAGPTSNASSMGNTTATSSPSTTSATTGAGPTTASMGSTSSSGGSAGTSSAGVGGTSGDGGTNGQSTGDVTTTTGGGGTGGGGFECTRDGLSSALDAYLAALAAGDPSSLPLAADLKFTENAEESEIGMTDFWMNAGEVKHSQRALDVDECTVAAHAVVPEGTTDLPIAIRIKLADGELSEIETIVVRPGDYTASFAVDSNPQAIIDIADDVGWDEVVPEGADRATREQLTSWIDKYFRYFPMGVCNVTGDCIRLENGGGNFNCGAGASCMQGDPGTGGNLIPRLILADVERGIVVGLTILSGHLDMHMAKMHGGSVHAVHAILRDTGSQSGWD